MTTHRTTATQCWLLLYELYFNAPEATAKLTAPFLRLHNPGTQPFPDRWEKPQARAPDDETLEYNNE